MAVVLAACGNGFVLPTGAGGNGGGSSGLTTSTGGITTSVTTGGGSGGGGGGPGPHGPGASQSVTAGSVCKSQSYRMVFTLGQPTQNQTRTTSSSYRMQGGLVGATESLP